MWRDWLCRSTRLTKIVIDGNVSARFRRKADERAEPHDVLGAFVLTHRFEAKCKSGTEPLAMRASCRGGDDAQASSADRCPTGYPRSRSKLRRKTSLCRSPECSKEPRLLSHMDGVCVSHVSPHILSSDHILLPIPSRLSSGHRDPS